MAGPLSAGLAATPERSVWRQAVAMLRICLLGPFHVERDGQVIPPHAWARPKDRAVLKMLALNRGHLVPQDRLLDALWPELGVTSAAKSLHVAVSRLRVLVEQAWRKTSPASYTLVFH